MTTSTLYCLHVTKGIQRFSHLFFAKISKANLKRLRFSLSFWEGSWDNDFLIADTHIWSIKNQMKRHISTWNGVFVNYMLSVYFSPLLLCCFNMLMNRILGWIFNLKYFNAFLLTKRTAWGLKAALKGF